MDDFAKVTAHLDTSGLKCPIPVIKAKKALRTMASGAILSIKTTDPLALIDIPHMCNELSYGLIKTERHDGYCLFLVKKT